MTEKTVWNEKMESMPREKMEKLRLERLKKQLKYCYQNSQFYKNRFDQAGAKPEDIKTWDGFRRLPVFMTKEGERTSQRESRERFGHPFGMHLCVPPEKILMVGTTTGTTGLPTFSYAFTEHDMERWNEGFARMYYLAGLRPGDRAVNCFPVSGGYAGGIMGPSSASMGVQSFNIGTEPGIERILRLIRLFNPNALISTPSFTLLLIDNCKEVLGIEPRELGIKKLLLGGEPGLGIPGIRSKIEGAFGGGWRDSLGGNSEGFCASCGTKEYMGLHEVAPDLSVCVEDLVDPVTKEPVKVEDGAIGEAVVTSVDREGVPYLKYAVGDVYQVFTKPCQCSYPGPGYRKKVVGRVEDLLIVDGVNVFPSAIRETISSFAPRVTDAMRIVLTEKPPKIASPLKVKVEYGPGIEEPQLEALGKEIRGKIKEMYKVDLDIEFLPPQTLERVAFKTPLFEKKY